MTRKRNPLKGYKLTIVMGAGNSYASLRHDMFEKVDLDKEGEDFVVLTSEVHKNFLYVNKAAVKGTWAKNNHIAYVENFQKKNIDWESGLSEEVRDYIVQRVRKLKESYEDSTNNKFFEQILTNKYTTNVSNVVFRYLANPHHNFSAGELCAERGVFRSYSVALFVKKGNEIFLSAMLCGTMINPPASCIRIVALLQTLTDKYTLWPTEGDISYLETDRRKYEAVARGISGKLFRCALDHLKASSVNGPAVVAHFESLSTEYWKAKQRWPKEAAESDISKDIEAVIETFHDPVKLQELIGIMRIRIKMMGGK